MNERELDDLVVRLKQTACGGTHWNEMLLSAAHAIGVLRNAVAEAEENALGWERKNAHNVGQYELELDAIRADLAAARAAIKRAASALHGGEGVTDQGQAWDLAMRVLDAALAKGDKP